MPAAAGKVFTFTEETARLHSRVEILNLLALLEYMNNDIPKCTVYLKAPLHRHEKRLCRSFLEFAPMAQLLSYYTTRQSKRTKHPDAELLIAFAKSFRTDAGKLSGRGNLRQTAAGQLKSC